MLFDSFNPNTLDLDWPSYLYSGNTEHRALLDYEDYLWFIRWQWRFKQSRNSPKGYLFRTVKVKVGSIWVSQNQWLHTAIMERIEPPAAARHGGRPHRPRHHEQHPRELPLGDAAREPPQ